MFGFKDGLYGLLEGKSQTEASISNFEPITLLRHPSTQAASWVHVCDWSEVVTKIVTLLLAPSRALTLDYTLCRRRRRWQHHRF